MSSSSPIEVSLYAKAFRFIPRCFGLHYELGIEVSPDCIVVDQDEMALFQKNVRHSFHQDAAFIDRSIRILSDAIQWKLHLLSLDSSSLVSSLADSQSRCRTIESLSWFCCNWLNPIDTLRTTILRLYGVANYQKVLDSVLVSRSGSSYIALSAKTPKQLPTSRNRTHVETVSRLQAKAERELEADQTRLLLSHLAFVAHLADEEETRRLLLNKLVKHIDGLDGISN